MSAWMGFLCRVVGRGLPGCLVVLGAGSGLVRAEVRAYTIEIPDGRAVSYELPFRVEHPGRLVILAEWTGPRILAFRLERTPGRVHEARRSGPSPQRIEVEVYPWELERDPEWTLTIRALAGRGTGSGTINLDLPDRPAERATPEPPPPAPAPPVLPEWARAQKPPPGASSVDLQLHRQTEALRRQAVRDDGTLAPDSCRWQSGLLRYLRDWRNRRAGGDLPAASTRRYLQWLAETVTRVEDVRTSSDPILAGPVPEQRDRYRAWLALRRLRLEPLERELDALGDALREDRAPGLRDLEWPARLVTCVTACERHFEQRVRLGVDAAINAELAAAQWDRILAARDALAALAALDSTPASASLHDR